MKNKMLFMLLLWSFLGLFSCAPSYQQFSHSPPRDPSVTRANDIEIVCGLQPFGNNRFRKKAARERIVAYNLQIKNTSPDTVYVDLGSIKLQNKETNLRALPAESAVAILKYAQAGYWWWSLFWITIRSEKCTSSDCDQTFIPLPIGVVIAATQYSKARASNNKMKQEFTSKGIDRLAVAPGHIEERLVFFMGVGGGDRILAFDLERSTNARENIRLPLGIDTRLKQDRVNITAKLILKKDKQRTYKGVVVRFEENGVVFDPDRSGLILDPEARFYSYDEIERLISQDDQIIYESQN